ncbi:hypothetical protein LGH83_15815 [Lichenihabitans sp. PAMC28606]|uniref:hypothetical protein n=1 Tax=Lichenihabitans sp. PAMC28606 TaxID=2880932 RepID=UPI001D0A09D3|nr:hypothetical protein [Lichenihabitans sp. PAMC28606]UDL94004.1 hypothetical protein LGH83_15815 [Lichenihabitans sp. PAMC28606]
MLVVWRGRGCWVIFLIALAAFLPIIVLWKVDGPEIDRGVAITMGLAAVMIAALGLRWNRGVTFHASAQAHSFWGIPMQLWALPTALFAILLGTGVITTAEASPLRPLMPITDRGAP